MSWQRQGDDEWQWMDNEDGTSGWTLGRATAHGTQWGAREQAGEEWHRANNDVETRSSATAAPQQLLQGIFWQCKAEDWRQAGWWSTGNTSSCWLHDSAQWQWVLS